MSETCRETHRKTTEQQWNMSGNTNFKMSDKYGTMSERRTENQRKMSEKKLRMSEHVITILENNITYLKHMGNAGTISENVGKLS